MDEGRPLAPLKEVLRRIHQVIEAGERRRVSQVEMASRLGISPRTYLEYLRGTHAPLAMRAVMDMLAMLNNDDLVTVVGEWKSTRMKARDDGNS
jgi:transcriptional regulator with XRE-family HTH domain